MMKKMQKPKVLFLCTHNSARSQMGEGLLRALAGDQYETYSAGTHPSIVNPYVRRVMAEIGIDLSTHRSKSVNEFSNMEIDYIVTVCDNAQTNCPFFPGGKEYIHRSFDDPSAFSGTDEDIMNATRKVRDQIKEWIISTFI